MKMRGWIRGIEMQQQMNWRGLDANLIILPELKFCNFDNRLLKPEVKRDGFKII